MSEHRSEKDTMGEVKVPASAYYGAQTERARQNFPIGGGGIPAVVVRALGLLKGAAAAVNQQLGLLDEQRAAAIQQAAQEVARNELDAHFVVDAFQTGSGTSSNMNANEVIANRACELLGAERGSKEVHPNDHVNLGQSSNDVFPSAVQLGLALAVKEQLLPELRSLALCLHEIADDTFDDVKTGRTHLMDALPIRFGQEFRGYASQVDRAIERIGHALDQVCELPLGGTAVGTGVNAHPKLASLVCAKLAEDCGLPQLLETSDHFQAQSCLDAVVHLSGALRGFATALFKIANDIRWMASGPLNGLAEIALPAVQPGSSIMPAKVNPVICESVLMLCGQVMANDVAVGFGNSQGQFELNTMMPFMARNAVESVVILANGLRMFRERCLKDLEVTEQAGKRVERNPMLVTALNAEIGYEAAAKIAKEAGKTERTVREIAAERTELDGDRLAELLDPRRLCGDGGRERRK
ncbi:MAG: class II fumarate hydratase [Planctomycetes bacterium]|nr:class II fumarate hydratase [Planctomycetota bacterium]